nr:hypothetical protein [uncultured archaeon]
MKRKYALILSLLITGLIASNVYIVSFIKNPAESVLVSRTIDGDTLVLENGETVRLLNINTPEKNEDYYKEAADYLKQLENKTAIVKRQGKDKYSRTLARVYLDDKYINLEIIEQGLAKKFLVEQSELKEFSDAEAQAIENEKGMWTHSENFNCLASEINQEEEIITLINSCQQINFQDWIITDESRKRYKFPSISFSVINIHSGQGNDNSTSLFWNQKQSVWNNDFDTLYVFDKEGNIAHYHPYGY